MLLRGAPQAKQSDSWQGYRSGEAAITAALHTAGMLTAVCCASAQPTDLCMPV